MLACDEIGVRLTVPEVPDGGWWEPTVVRGTRSFRSLSEGVSPRGSVGTPANGVLLRGKWGDDGLGIRWHGDQCSGCPAI